MNLKVLSRLEESSPAPRPIDASTWCWWERPLKSTVHKSALGSYCAWGKTSSRKECFWPYGFHWLPGEFSHRHKDNKGSEIRYFQNTGPGSTVLMFSTSPSEIILQGPGSLCRVKCSACPQSYPKLWFPKMVVPPLYLIHYQIQNWVEGILLGESLRKSRAILIPSLIHRTYRKRASGCVHVEIYTRRA